MNKINGLDWLAIALVIIGGLNWGLVGLFNIDLITTLFGEMSAISRIVYALIGVSAVYMLYTITKIKS